MQDSSGVACPNRQGETAREEEEKKLADEKARLEAEKQKLEAERLAREAEQRKRDEEARLERERPDAIRTRSPPRPAAPAERTADHFRQVTQLVTT